MKIESRLQQLEKATSPGHANFIRRPADVSKALWQRAMNLLADYSPEMLYPWTSLQDVAETCRAFPQTEWMKLPNPVTDVVSRAWIEEETGELWPDWITSTLDQVDEIPEIPEANLVEDVRMIDIGEDDYCLPSPYSLGVLRQVADEDALTQCLERCRDYADKLHRGEITAEEHAAELAKFLPPITRADQENALRTFVEQSLPVHLRRPSVPAVEAGNG